MTLLKHELRRGKITLIIWTAIIVLMLAVCIVIYPEMENQMNEMSDMFAQMGSFSAAFGMDKINFGEFTGYFSVECGNVLGLGGAFFAALLGIMALAKEEKERTAEFLLTHPISRKKIVTQKLCSVLIQIAILNAVVIGITALSVVIIGESPDTKALALLFLAYFILQVEVASICFGISAFISSGGLGIGLGMAAIFYFLNIIANLTEQAKYLKYITPFGYAEGSDIIANKNLNIEYLAFGLILTAIGIIIAYIKYCKKDMK